ncbi:MAG: DUF7112 family protein [Halobacteriota archaeon]
MDAVASDHPSVRTLRATVARHGGRRRLDVADPEGLLEPGIVRAVVDDRTRFALVDLVAGTPAVVGLFETVRSAEARAFDRDRLVAWLEAAERPPGRTVLVDVLEPGERIGLRRPGERTTYPVVGEPDGSLADIARSLEED